jgi:hypothetical protein
MLRCAFITALMALFVARGCVVAETDLASIPPLTMQEGISILEAEDDWGDGAFPFVILEDWPRDFRSVARIDAPRPGMMGHQVTFQTERNLEVAVKPLDLAHRSVPRRVRLLEFVASFEEYEVFEYDKDCLVIANKALLSTDRWKLNDPLPPEFDGELPCGRALLRLYQHGGMDEHLDGTAFARSCPDEQWGEAVWTTSLNRSGLIRDAAVALLRKGRDGRRGWCLIRPFHEVDPLVPAKSLAMRDNLNWRALDMGVTPPTGKAAMFRNAREREDEKRAAHEAPVADPVHAPVK